MAFKNKVYLSLIGVGVIALGVDRFYPGTTSPASSIAGPLEPEAMEGGAQDISRPQAGIVAKPAGTTRLTVPELHFPRDLPIYDPADELRDVFSPLAADGSPMTASRKDKASKECAENAIGREDFPARHRIDAVMVQESLKIAVVDGRWTRVGDMVDSCKLVRIDGNSVVFECHDGVTELSTSGKRRGPSD